MFWANRPLISIFFNQQLTHNMLIIIITIIYFKIIDSISILDIYLVGKNIKYLSMQEINNIKLIHFFTTRLTCLQHRRRKFVCVNN